MTRPTLRFAPSPNGRLHLGHAYSALLNADFTRRLGGRLLLRIEDLDPVRSRPDLIAAIHDDLAWLGLSFEPHVMRQSQHLGRYAQILDRLAARGLAYPCFCSRSTVATSVAAFEGADATLWPRDPDGVALYPGTCRTLTPSQVADRITAGASHAWRIDIARACDAVPGPHGFGTFAPDGSVAADPARWGDAVIGRRDVRASYHLAVVLDDAMQGITHVVRGADLLAATDLHVLLQALLGLATPRYHHHALIMDTNGEKLAKSRGSPSLADLRAAGLSPRAIRARLGFLD